MDLLESFEDQVRPMHAAVLVIDMQNDFCAEGGFLHAARGYDMSFAPQLADSIGALVEGARRSGTPVAWIRSYYDFKYLTAPHRVKRKVEGCCLEDSWGAEFYQLRPAPDEIVITKHHFSGFKGTALDDRLQAGGIRTLIMTGVATNVCVDSTLRDGFFLGYHIVLVEDCVASNSAAGHEGTLATVRNNIGIVASSRQVLAALQA